MLSRFDIENATCTTQEKLPPGDIDRNEALETFDRNQQELEHATQVAMGKVVELAERRKSV